MFKGWSDGIYVSHLIEIKTPWMSLHTGEFDTRWTFLGPKTMIPQSHVGSEFFLFLGMYIVFHMAATDVIAKLILN